MPNASPTTDPAASTATRAVAASPDSSRSPRPKRRTVAFAAEPEPIGQGGDRRLLLRPAAFLKLAYLCHAADTEVGGFCISSERDPLVVEDFVLLRQSASVVTTELDDDAVADHVESMAQRGVAPARCGRIWTHTHPGTSTVPSWTDERTFRRCFGGCDWSAMLILARGGDASCRVQFPAGPGGCATLPVAVDWAALPAWLREHAGDLPAFVDEWERQLRERVRQDGGRPPDAGAAAAEVDAALREIGGDGATCFPRGIRRGLLLADDEPDVGVLDRWTLEEAGVAARHGLADVDEAELLRWYDATFDDDDRPVIGGSDVPDDAMARVAGAVRREEVSR